MGRPNRGRGLLEAKTHRSQVYPNRPFRLEFYCFDFNSLHHGWQERRQRLPNVLSPAGRQNNGPRGEPNSLEPPGLRICPRRVTVLPRFCRLWPRVAKRAHRADASGKGKSKDRRKQIIRVLLLNGVHENVFRRDGSAFAPQQRFLWRKRAGPLWRAAR
jgi:hypothetical protein